MSSPIHLIDDGDVHWVVVDGKRLIGYASLTRAEAFKAGYEARKRGAKREEADRYQAPEARWGVDLRAMRNAWQDGWYRSTTRDEA